MVPVRLAEDFTCAWIERALGNFASRNNRADLASKCLSLPFLSEKGQRGHTCERWSRKAVSKAVAFRIRDASGK